MQKATINDAVTPKATEIVEDKIADLNLGTAATANVEDFATAAQGLLADSAVLYAPQTLSPSEQAQARENIGTVLQSSATDTTAGRVLKVGAFGIGAPLVGVDQDLDNYKVPGFYTTPAS